MENIKIEQLEQLMHQYTKQDLALAFSGGVDSSLLLALASKYAKKNGTKVYAYTIHTMLHPMEELSITQQMAKKYGAIHKVVEVDELEEAGIRNNPENRCYLCKKCMFTKVLADAQANGISQIMEGTNYSDTLVYRPGIAAIKELGLLSPLLEAGFTKDEVRALAAKYEVQTSDRPSTPCMATRFPYGCELKEAELKRVEQAEQFIRGKGFYNVRARIHENMVRIEVDEADIEKLLAIRAEVIAYMKELGYDYVAVDLEGFRSGSQDLHVSSR